MTDYLRHKEDKFGLSRRNAWLSDTPTWDEPAEVQVTPMRNRAWTIATPDGFMGDVRPPRWDPVLREVISAVHGEVDESDSLGDLHVEIEVMHKRKPPQDRSNSKVSCA